MTKTLRVLASAFFLISSFAATPAPTVTFSQPTSLQHPGNLQTREKTTSPVNRLSETTGALPPQAVFPVVEVVKYDERIGITTAGRRGRAVLTLRITNKGSSSTDALVLTIKDNNQLLRQSTSLRIPSLAPGASQLRNVQLEAEVTDGSQSPQATAEWKVRYRFRCGPEFQAVMDFAGSQGMAPRSGHFQRNLPLEAGSGPQVEADPNRTLCDSTQCIKPCVMAKEIHKQLDGHVVGYSFFVGLSPENLGWDVSNDRELEKNGGYGGNWDGNGENCAIISTSVAIFGPVRGPNLVGVLFMNSNISGGPNDNKGAREVLETAYQNSLMPK